MVAEKIKWELSVVKPRAYHEFKGTVLWIYIENLIKELQVNRDITITTHPDLVYGFFTKNLSHYINKEVLFIESIDARFPYKNRTRCTELILEGSQISPNAAYMVLYELIVAPDKISNKILNELIYTWFEKCKAIPLSDKLVKVAHSRINEKVLPIKFILDLLTEISQYKGLYNALNIVCYSDISNSSKVYEKYKEILQYWSVK